MLLNNYIEQFKNLKMSNRELSDLTGIPAATIWRMRNDVTTSMKWLHFFAALENNGLLKLPSNIVILDRADIRSKRP